MRKVVYVLIFLLLISSYGISSTFISYLIASVLMIITVFKIITSQSIPKLKGLFDYFPLLMILVWAYGVGLGFLKGNNPFFVVSNFAGMSLYFIYYTFHCFKLNVFILYKIVFTACLVNIVYAFIELFISGYASPFYGLELNSFRVYYSTGLLVTAPIISLIIARYIFGIDKFILSSYINHKFLGFIVLVFAISALVVLSVSKGFFLSLVALLLIFLSIVVSKIFLYGKLRESECLYIFIVVGIVSIIVLSFPEIVNVVVYTFSDLEPSNLTRSMQKSYIVSELSFFGKGLGGVLEGGYIRNELLPYAYELTYLNLVHKVGVFSLVPFIIYICTCALAWIDILILRNIFYPALALGAMMFLIPSYGNPMLFSPISVVLHCLALYWLRRDSILKFRRGLYVFK